MAQDRTLGQHPSAAVRRSSRQHCCNFKRKGKDRDSGFQIRKNAKVLNSFNFFFFSFFPDFIKDGNSVTGTGEMKVCSLNAVCLTAKITELVTKAAHIVGFFNVLRRVVFVLAFLTKAGVFTQSVICDRRRSCGKANVLGERVAMGSTRIRLDCNRCREVSRGCRSAQQLSQGLRRICRRGWDVGQLVTARGLFADSQVLLQPCLKTWACWQSNLLLRSSLLKAVWPAPVTTELLSSLVNIEERHSSLLSLLHISADTMISAAFFTASPLWPLPSDGVKREPNSEHEISAAQSSVCAQRWHKAEHGPEEACAIIIFITELAGGRISLGRCCTNAKQKTCPQIGSALGS